MHAEKEGKKKLELTRDRASTRSIFSFAELIVESIRGSARSIVTARRNENLLGRIIEQTKKESTKKEIKKGRGREGGRMMYSPSVQESTSRLIAISKNNPDRNLSLEPRSPESLGIPRNDCGETTSGQAASGDARFARKNTLILSSNSETIPGGQSVSRSTWSFSSAREERLIQKRALQLVEPNTLCIQLSPNKDKRHVHYCIRR